MVNDFACSLREGTAEAADYIELYESILKLAEDSAKEVRYECEMERQLSNIEGIL